MKKQTIKYAIFFQAGLGYRGFMSGRRKKIIHGGSNSQPFTYFKTKKKCFSYIQSHPGHVFGIHRLFCHKPRNGKSVDMEHLGYWRSSIGNKNL